MTKVYFSSKFHGMQVDTTSLQLDSDLVLHYPTSNLKMFIAEEIMKSSNSSESGDTKHGSELSNLLVVCDIKNFLRILTFIFLVDQEHDQKWCLIYSCI